MRRCVIVNADDLGLSPEINEGVLSGLKQGIISDTSVLIRHRISNMPLQD